MLQRETDLRREERFFWIFVVTMLLDVIGFKVLDNWAGCLAVFLLELIFLAAIGKWLGVEHVAVPLERLFNHYLPGKDK